MQSRKGMPLARALRIEKGDVVSFVGGGGKTSSMFRLAAELSAAGLRVLTSTTTHISERQALIAPAVIGLTELDLLGERLDRYGQCLLVGPPDGNGRVTAAPPDLITSLHERSDIDVIVVESDGSRSLPFKAPGDHEPVVPAATTILAPIAGLNSIGTPLDEGHVHRSAIAAAIAGQELGSTVTAATLARVLCHPRGGAKQRPAGARLAPLLNKADSEEAVRHARDAAALMLAAGADSVIISAMIQDPPVCETWAPVAGIVLAAGMSTRFGETKQILQWNDTGMAAHCARTAVDAGLDPVIVVLGCEAALVEKTLAGLPVRIAVNPEFEAGQSTSIRYGLDALPPRTAAAMFILADQPLVTADTMRSIVEAHRRTFAPACAPVCEGRRGNPVLFDRTLFDELRNLRGDAGGRILLEQHRDRVVSVPADRAVMLDIDTPGDYQQQKQP